METEFQSPDCIIEIWQANAVGKYAHPADTQDQPLEQGFLGFGRIPTDDGRIPIHNHQAWSGSWTCGKRAGSSLGGRHHDARLIARPAHACLLSCRAFASHRSHPAVSGTYTAHDPCAATLRGSCRPVPLGDTDARQRRNRLLRLLAWEFQACEVFLSSIH